MLNPIWPVVDVSKKNIYNYVPSISSSHIVYLADPRDTQMNRRTVTFIYMEFTCTIFNVFAKKKKKMIKNL